MFTMYTSRKKRQIIKPYNRISVPDFKISSAKITAILVVACLLCVNTTIFASNRFNQDLSKLSPDSTVILHDESGTPLIAFNPETQQIPASIIKIITAQAALDLLGQGYRFKTDFFSDQNGNLIIKGWGDPFLISEEIEVISAHLKEKGLVSVTQIFVDDSAFSEDVLIDGTSGTLNPYDALNGALVVNFNTLFLGRNEDGTVYSAEDYTPLTPLALTKGELIEPGKEERINLAGNASESLQYVGQLFSAFFKEMNIPIGNDKVARREVDDRCTLLYRHESSKSLDFILMGLLKYSNNFIANQLFLTLGAEKTDYPASLKKSRTVMNNYLSEKWHFNPGTLKFHEASGISRLNRVTGRQMIKVLESFKPFSHLLSRKDGILLKSGTLSDIHNYAGYFETATGLQPFVIITHQTTDKRDQILEMLKAFNEHPEIFTN